MGSYGPYSANYMVEGADYSTLPPGRKNHLLKYPQMVQTPTQRSVRIYRTTLFSPWFTAQLELASH